MGSRVVKCSAGSAGSANSLAQAIIQVKQRQTGLRSRWTKQQKRQADEISSLFNPLPLFLPRPTNFPGVSLPADGTSHSSQETITQPCLTPLQLQLPDEMAILEYFDAVRWRLSVDADFLRSHVMSPVASVIIGPH